ncbi:hypothetical protein Mtc_0287 [Methanocella conradii HZ254]|uniref:Uncharacterized protein n=2 Tax=Methanocella TaxID=570266 RepID=H8I955_METCZ|nr:hypothetical protein Mtc_0287 [Methanocella conradii HZ254]
MIKSNFYFFIIILFLMMFITIYASQSFIVNALDTTGSQPGFTAYDRINDSLSDLYNKYPDTNDSRVIMDFTNAHGFGGWYSKNAYEGYADSYPEDAKKPVAYDYLYILPAKDYDKKLIVLYQTMGAWTNTSENGIRWTLEINISEERPQASSVYELFWPGSDYLFEFYGMHPNAKNNSEIENFINTYGMSGWYEKTAYPGFKYIYVLPKRDYYNNLVFLNEITDERRVNTSIRWVKFIDKGEELPPLNESEARAMGIIGSATPEIKTDTVSATPAPGFVPVSAMAGVAIALLIKMKRKSE